MEYGNVAEKYQDLLPGYFNNQEIEVYSEIENNLEQIIGQRKQQTLDMLFSDKSKTLKATVKELLNEISLRKKLNSELLTKMNEDICKCKTYLHEIRDIVKRNYEAQDVKFGRRRTQLENMILSLEQEKRKEYVECWRDLMFLKKYLMSALADYWELNKKRESLSYGLNLLDESVKERVKER